MRGDGRIIVVGNKGQVVGFIVGLEDFFTFSPALIVNPYQCLKYIVNEKL